MPDIETAPLHRRDMKRLHSRELYKELASEIRHILHSVEALQEDPQANGVKRTVNAVLEPLSQESEARIQELARNAEWDTFVIGFYGETNAGKSTVVETLRILLGEAGKLDERRAFREIQERYGLSADSLRQAQLEVETAAQACEDCTQAHAREQAEREGEVEAASAELRATASEMARRRAAMNRWQRFLALFRQDPAAAVLLQKTQRLKAAEAALAQALDSHQARISGLRDVLASRQQALDGRRAQLDLLLPHADGRIIGNGRSDFTLQSQLYRFEVQGQRFALIDVPGIEGSEGKVEQAIWEAVQKAHAVFYVTPKPAAPQKGEDGKPGTLEKIKRHLGDQTEGWTLYNKGATNPMALSAPELLNADEQRSLADLDRKLREQLGSHYARTLSISARPAFLAVAECLVPGGTDAATRDKFLGKFDRDSLLAKSNLPALVDLLSGPLVKGQQDKIMRSNLFKGRQLVHRTLAGIEGIYEDHLKPFKAELAVVVKDSTQQMDLSVRALSTRLDNVASAAVRQFIKALREDAYDYIDGDVSNDALRSYFADARDRRMAEATASLTSALEHEFASFREEVADALERFRDFANDLQSSFGSIRIAGSTAPLKLDLSQGIDWTGLISTAIGGLLLAWNPGGWLILATGIATVLLGLAKSFIGFFSSDYKKAQQCKAIDQQLDSMRGSLLEGIRADLKRSVESVESEMETMKAAMRVPLENATALNKIVKRSIDKLKLLAASMAAPGDI
ncbi:hypothetical protein QRD43_08990 [Pelomonas sp. APW6]|uniref:G domain-containing protein n=1 Tax=Roseateles subflavus TaxID=3053353 RepID=A0ABT7LGR6_9BURK|nr:hypothetical protein [Pelomonas sp. APW6]MDL5032043.1 hypothetical protein [Pelomonas sp. APW6]